MHDECTFFDRRILFCDLYLSDFLISKKIVFASLISLKKLNALFSQKLGKPKKVKIFPHIRWVKMIPSRHMSLQPYGLQDDVAKILLTAPEEENRRRIKLSVPDFEYIKDEYSVVQLCAGGAIHIYKNWSIDKWMILLSELAKDFPKIKWVMIGGDAVEDIENHPMWLPDKYLNLLGKTNINESSQIIKGAKFYLGLDSGPMHLAAFLGVPTFSLWGPTDHLAYGYESINPKLNKVIRLDLMCSPCESPLRNPTVMRYKNPMVCPEKECMKNLNVSNVLPECIKFIQKVR
jgi:ADP-heptose:LPS heptosyltransferase